jgi:glycosyltransferase involved in cell wall biosynthesis
MIVHGFPPRETAGTEQHVLQLRDSLTARGHAVHVLTATRAAGARQYEQRTDPGVTRIVNNLTTRRLSEGEADATIDRITAEVVARFCPDLVHVHHIQFMSSATRFAVPMVMTLHDRWGWCAAGGLGLLADGTVCTGPSPERCAPCAAAWAPTPGGLAQRMRRTAERLSPLIPPDRLHGLYQRIPARLKPRPERGVGPVEDAAAAAHRNTQVGDFYRGAHVRISPSTHLAIEAEARGLGPVEVIEHGIPHPPMNQRTNPSPGPGPRTGLVHLGTISAHKGTDLVVRAWRAACPSGQPGLRLHGTIIEPEAALGHPVGPVLQRPEVMAALAGARALVLAPRWIENAPLIVLEARSMGCPVIAPAAGGFLELIEDGRDGWLFDPETPGGLEQAIRTAIAGPLPSPRPPPGFEAQVDAIEAVYHRLVSTEVEPCA